MKRQADKTALVIYYYANRKLTELNLEKEAVAEFQQVLRLFPESIWAGLSPGRCTKVICGGSWKWAGHPWILKSHFFREWKPCFQFKLFVEELLNPPSRPTATFQLKFYFNLKNTKKTKKVYKKRKNKLIQNHQKWRLDHSSPGKWKIEFFSWSKMINFCVFFSEKLCRFFAFCD